MIELFLETRKWKIEELAQRIGIWVAVYPTIKYGWLYLIRFKWKKNWALVKSRQNFKATVTIAEEAQQDLFWWITNISKSKNPTRQENYKLEIFTDASPHRLERILSRPKRKWVVGLERNKTTY